MTDLEAEAIKVARKAAFVFSHMKICEPWHCKVVTKDNNPIIVLESMGYTYHCRYLNFVALNQRDGLGTSAASLGWSMALEIAAFLWMDTFKVGPCDPSAATSGVRIQEADREAADAGRLLLGALIGVTRWPWDVRVYSHPDAGDNPWMEVKFDGMYALTFSYGLFRNFFKNKPELFEGLTLGTRVEALASFMTIDVLSYFAKLARDDVRQAAKEELN